MSGLKFEDDAMLRLEALYRFPLLPDVDTTIAYQAVLDPAFHSVFDCTSVFSLRLTTSF